MRHSNNITPVFPAVILAALIHLSIASIAFGGIDIDRYYFYSFGIDYGLPRYFREPISWELIRLLTSFVDRSGFLLGVSALVLTMSVLLLGWRSGLILYAAFLSPFGVMLEFNVLRQCFGTLLMCVAAYHLVGDRQKRAMLFGGAAILCHTSSIFTLSVVCAVFLMTRMRLAWRLATAAATAFMLAGLQALGLLAILSDRSSTAAAEFGALTEDGSENLLYVAASLLICTALYLFGEAQKLRLLAMGLAASTCLAALISSMLSMGSWVYGRIAIGNLIIGSFLLLQQLLLRPKNNSSQAGMAVALLAFNGLLIFAHPGAMYMLTGLR